MQIYADTLNIPFAPVNANQLFGNFSMFSIEEFPAFADYSLSDPLNCTKNIPASWTARVYLSDSIHGDNYLNYQEIEWFTGYSILEGFPPTSEEAEDFINMLTGGNDFWKFLFGMILMFAVVIGSAIALSKNGVDGVATGVISAVIGLSAMIVLSFMGIFPFWIPVLMVLIVGLIITWLIMKPFSSGG